MGRYCELMTKLIDKGVEDEVWTISEDMLNKLSRKDPIMFDEYIEKLEHLAYRIPKDEAERIVRAMRPKGQYWSYTQVYDLVQSKGVTGDWSSDVCSSDLIDTSCLAVTSNYKVGVLNVDGGCGSVVTHTQGGAAALLVHANQYGCRNVTEFINHSRSEDHLASSNSFTILHDAQSNGAHSTTGRDAHVSVEFYLVDAGLEEHKAARARFMPCGAASVNASAAEQDNSIGCDRLSCNIYSINHCTSSST